jgi:alpha-mannosidase
MEYSQPQIIRRKLDELRLAIYDYEEALRGWETRIGQYVGEGAYAGVEPAWTAIDVGDTWVPAFHLTRWFRRRVEVPAALAGRKIWLDLNVGGEGLVRVDGSIASGLSSYSFGSLMDRSRVLLCACAKGGESFEVEIEATLNYGEANMRRLEGAAELVYTFEKAKLAVVNDEAEGAWFDLHTAFEAMQALKNPIANLTSSALRLAGELAGAIEAVSRDT